MKTVVANNAAQALIDRSLDKHLKSIDLESSSWRRVYFIGWDLSNALVQHQSEKFLKKQNRKLSFSTSIKSCVMLRITLFPLRLFSILTKRL